MLDLAPGITSGQLRHDGFLKGFGLTNGDPEIVGAVNTEGDRVKAQAAMTQLLQQHPDINIVYTVNEPAAFGAAAAPGARRSSDPRRTQGCSLSCRVKTGPARLTRPNHGTRVQYPKVRRPPGSDRDLGGAIRSQAA